jgi:hypothetical protein
MRRYAISSPFARATSTEATYRCDAVQQRELGYDVPAIGAAHAA